MAKRGLNQVDWRAVIEGVGGVRVPQPMGADLRGFVRDAGVFGSLPQNDPNPSTIKGLAAPGGEH